MIRPASICVVALSVALGLLAGCDAKITDPADFVPPEVTITAPETQSVVSGVSFVVLADATDNQGIERVDFQVDDFEPVPVTEPPYATRLVSFGQTEGTVATVTATAHDISGNTAVDQIVVEVGAQTITRITTNVGEDLNPTWSPDGSLIAYQSVQSGSTGTYDIWTIAPDGSNPQRITFGVQNERNPAWSPDGQWIAFDSDATVQYEVYKMPATDIGEQNAVQLTFANEDDVEPAWSPDGLDVYFSSNRGESTPFNIWRVAASGDSSTTLQITAYPNPDTCPAISPSGRFLAFSSTLSLGTPHVWILELGNQQVYALTGDLALTEIDPAWATSGGEVVTFSRTQSGSALPSRVWVQDALGNAVLQGTFGAGVQGEGGSMWSPDGTRIAFHSDRDGNPDLFIIE